MSVALKHLTDNIGGGSHTCDGLEATRRIPPVLADPPPRNGRKLEGSLAVRVEGQQCLGRLLAKT